MSRPLVVVGDALLDRDVDGRAERLCPDAPAPVLDDATETARPGGAALAAAIAAADTDHVVLLTALGGAAGDEVARLAADAGVDVVDLGLDGDTPEKVRYRAGGHVLLRVDRGGGAPRQAPSVPARAVAELLSGAAAVLVADYGRGMAAHPDVRDALAECGAPVVWDPHPRGPAPVPGAALVTPNAAELLGGAAAGATMAEVHAAAHDAIARWQAAAVAATLGSRGALLADGSDGPPLAVPARRLPAAVDPCGAGDCFAATAAARLGAGAVASEAVVDAVAAATAFVAAGGASGWRARTAPVVTEVADPRDVAGVAARLDALRRRGGVVVATGGCFDLFHAGHAHLLEAAARLGDALVVCINSDASVRRLKGPGRPVVAEADRMAVLAAVGCVDEVVCFDEATPEAVLDVLRPDVFVKGGDYTGRPIPEVPLLAGWGGQVVTVPYLGGRSTTRLLARMVGDDAVG